MSRGDRPADPTLAAYEEGADRWIERRPPERTRAAAFGRSLRPGTVVDLGCGPGWHLPDLPTGTIALDGAAAMLARVPEHAPAAPRVRADLHSLPFARHSLDAAWANKSYVHLDRREVPLALWDLHRALRVEGTAALGLFAATRGAIRDADHGEAFEDSLPGRRFSFWTEDLLATVVEGAGFTVLRRAEDPIGDDRQWTWTLRRERTLADTVAPDMRLLLVGLNPSIHAADAGVGFARPGNRAWPALLAAGLATVDRDPLRLLADGGVGMTDLVKRATARADELAAAEFRAGLDRLERLCAWLRPGAVAVAGVTGWRAATGHRAAAVGWQERSLGGRPVYLMPNPSGLNAHTSVEDLAGHLRRAAGGTGAP
ncbi:MAG: uracil-DNA glycosylase family protein [Microthrixaceae bacterium]